MWVTLLNKSINKHGGNGSIAAQFISNAWWYFGFHNSVVTMLITALMQPKSLQNYAEVSAEEKDRRQPVA